MLSLNSDRIDLWIIPDDEMGSKFRFFMDKNFHFLTNEEQAKGNKFLFIKDRVRYLVTRIAIRIVLSKYVKILPANWMFGKNRYGRPEIMNDDPVAKRIRFNISHTNGLIIIGITCDGDIGVDVENFQTHSVQLEIIKNNFSPHEILSINALSGDAQKKIFFQYWTLKEAYIKARGMGFSISMNKFCFSLHAQKIDFFNSEILSENMHCFFLQYQVNENFLVSICIQRLANAKLPIVIDMFSYFDNDDPVDCVLLGSSEKFHQPK